MIGQLREPPRGKFKSTGHGPGLWRHLTALPGSSACSRGAMGWVKVGGCRQGGESRDGVRPLQDVFHVTFRRMKVMGKCLLKRKGMV